ncbi:MAG: right-handed parallel beta-helix repeat-containing protein [Candidatus Hodarchaeales archaeon]|jgi:parallel beta-helix repeat protein
MIVLKNKFNLILLILLYSFLFGQFQPTITDNLESEAQGNLKTQYHDIKTSDDLENSYLINIQSLGVEFLNNNKKISETDIYRGKSEISQIQSLTQISPIMVDGNANFTSHGIFTGYGNKTHPYEFKDYYINAGGVSGIKILNTNAYFRIENVEVNGSTNFEAGAIHLDNVTFGELINNTATESYVGFVLENSNNNTLTKNTAQNNSFFSFYLKSSDNNTLSENFAQNNNNGFYISYPSNYNVLSNNMASSNTQNGYYINGITFLTSNSASNNGETGFKINGLVNSDLKDNIASDNIIHGFEITNSINNTLIDNGATSNGETGFHLANLVNSTLTTNTATNNYHDGFFLSGTSDNNSLIRNTASSNGMNGYYLYGSSRNLLDSNTASSNHDHGLYIYSGSNFNNLKYNTFTNNNDLGISLYDRSNNNTFFHNTIKNSSVGIQLEYTWNNTIKNNDFQDNGVGIHQRSSKNTEISNNVINNHGRGIEFYDHINEHAGNSNTIVSDNTISNLEYMGISIYSTNNIYIINNEISNIDNEDNSGIGIQLDQNSSDNTVFSNLIKNVDRTGISIHYLSDRNEIINNTVFNCQYFGIEVSYSDWNLVKYNDFIATHTDPGYIDIYFDHLIYSQAFVENSREITFINNFWDEWTGPDHDNDGFVDDSYELEGDSLNFDGEPLSSPHNPKTKNLHFLTRPRILLPEVDQSSFRPTEVSRTISIEWHPVTDSKGHSITYEIYYSLQGQGIPTWEKLIALADTIYEWNTLETTTEGEIQDIELKIVAVCSEGLTSERGLDHGLSINNPLIETQQTSGFSSILVILSISTLIIVFRKIKTKI